MLKINLTAAEHAALAAAIQSEYKASGSGYILDTDQPFEDVTGLKSALASEKQEKLNAKARIDTLTAENTVLLARAGTPQELEKSWQAKYDKAVADGKASVDKTRKQLRVIMVDNVANSLASEISTVPTLLIPHIKNRLRMEEGDDETLITRVLTPDGKASAMSLNELKTELIANQDFAPILKASSASGGGSTGSTQGAPGGSKEYRDMTESERTELYRKNKPDWQKQRDAWVAAGSPAPQQAK